MLERLTTVPPVGAAALRVIVHASDPAPVKLDVPQERADRTGDVVPLNPIVVVLPVDELLERVIWPAEIPAAAGSNCTAREALCPGFKVMGKLAPISLNPDPVTVPELTVTAVFPVELNVTDCVDTDPTATVPKFTLELLIVRVD